MANAFALNLAQPFNRASQTSATLAATLTQLYPVAAAPTAQQYFVDTGDAWRIEVFGQITTAVTPGNIVASILYGTGASANGVTLASTAAVALTASQTALSWEAIIDIEARSIGSTGTLFTTFNLKFNNAVVASTLQPLIGPASSPVVSAACDLTSTVLFPNLQFSRSGSTVETAIVHKVRYIKLN